MSGLANTLLGENTSSTHVTKKIKTQKKKERIFQWLTFSMFLRCISGRVRIEKLKKTVVINKRTTELS